MGTYIFRLPTVLVGTTEQPGGLVLVTAVHPCSRPFSGSTERMKLCILRPAFLATNLGHLSFVITLTIIG